MKTLREEITEAFAQNQESWEAVESHTLTLAALTDPYARPPFTLWTKNRVYFPAVYDGDEWVHSVPRHPNNEATEPVGGS